MMDFNSIANLLKKDWTNGSQYVTEQKCQKMKMYLLKHLVQISSITYLSCRCLNILSVLIVAV